jgi:hypothetical protein
MAKSEKGTASGTELPRIAPAEPEVANSDLAAAAFVVLRRTFFDERGGPVRFELRPKRNTQDDPFDEYVELMLRRGLMDASCIKATGPLITPDMVLYRPEKCVGIPRDALRSDLTRVVGIEVKKLERTPGGGVARASGMDYNTTPPCGTVRVYDATNTVLPVRGFYLFVCLEQSDGGASQVTAMLLTDGNLLNADFKLYCAIVGERTKRINLGTYGDGADRVRPMLLFANPLGCTEFNRHPTFLHPCDNLQAQFDVLRRIGVVRRTLAQGGEPSAFHAYRYHSDVPDGAEPFDLLDPFPMPARKEQTAGRGRFLLDIHPTD